MYKRQELAQAKTALQSKDIISQAKALLMQKQNLTEPQAYEKMRKMAMNKGLKIAEIAQNMIDMAELWV